HASHALSCAMRMRAGSRSDAGSFDCRYAVAIIRSTMPAISGRRDHTMAASPPGPSGMSIRAMGASARLRDDLGVIVLGADLLQVLEPTAVVDLGGALPNRVLEVPRLTLVRPVRRMEPVRRAPMGDCGFVIAGSMQMLAQLELGGRRRLVARSRVRA